MATVSLVFTFCAFSTSENVPCPFLASRRYLRIVLWALTQRLGRGGAWERG